MNSLKSYQLPQPSIVVGPGNSLLFSYCPRDFSFKYSQNLYEYLTVCAARNLTELLKLEMKLPEIINLSVTFVRLKFIFTISMPFIIKGQKIIADPNGADILHRKLNSVFN